jgi:hypothetical protein
MLEELIHKAREQESQIDRLNKFIQTLRDGADAS